MKQLAVVISLMVALSAFADDSIAVVSSRRPMLSESMENVIVHQDSAITRLVDATVNGSGTEVVEVPGYRVQIFSSNRQQTAKTEAMQLEKSISTGLDVNVYVQYAPPFWKVRLGDFLTIEEAQAYKQEFIKQHPQLQGDTYVVRDQVKSIR